MHIMGKTCKCDRCDAVMYDGDTLYSWVFGNANEGLVCSDCFDELFDELNRDERAELIGSEKHTVCDFFISAGAYYG